MNRRFILGIFEHVGIDFRPYVKTPVYQPDLFGSRGYFRVLDARAPCLQLGPQAIGRSPIVAFSGGLPLGFHGLP